MQSAAPRWARTQMAGCSLCRAAKTDTVPLVDRHIDGQRVAHIYADVRAESETPG